MALKVSFVSTQTLGKDGQPIRQDDPQLSPDFEKFLEGIPEEQRDAWMRTLLFLDQPTNLQEGKKGE